LDEPSLDPGADPSVDPGTDPDLSPEPSDDPGYGATACTGTDDNRAFFEMVASKVQWDVYCAALPAGWHVATGSYRLAGGAALEMDGRRPEPRDRRGGGKRPHGRGGRLEREPVGFRHLDGPVAARIEDIEVDGDVDRVDLAGDGGGPRAERRDPRGRRD